MNSLRCLVILVAMFASSISAQTSNIPHAYEKVLHSASAGNWREVWAELEEVGILIVEVWDRLMGEAIRQDDQMAVSELVQRGRAAEIIDESTQFSICPVSPNSAARFLAAFVLEGAQEQVEFDPQALTPIGAVEAAENLDTDLGGEPANPRAALLDEVVTVLNFDGMN